MPADIAGYLQISPGMAGPEAPLWAAIALVAGGLLGEFVRRVFGLPRIVGYSAVGLVIGLIVGRGLGVMQGTARLIVDLALLATSAAESLLAFGAIYGALRWLGQPVPVALTCATLGTCASGAVIARVASELESAGQVTERMIVLTTLNTLFAVLVHKLVVGWLHLETAGDWVRALSQPLWAFGGSVLLAAALAFLVAGIARRLNLRDENAALMLLGLVVLALVAGGALALVLLVVRWLAKAGAVLAFTPSSGLRWRQGLGLALALTPISATALVLLADLHASHPGFAPLVTPIILSAIAFSELLGPLAVQWGPRLAGEHHPEPLPRPAHAVPA